MIKNKHIYLDDPILPEEAAEIIERNTGKPITVSWIRELCASSVLKAQKLGRAWLIERESAEKFERGRPGTKPKRKI